MSISEFRFLSMKSATKKTQISGTLFKKSLSEKRMISATSEKDQKFHKLKNGRLKWT